MGGKSIHNIGNLLEGNVEKVVIFEVQNLAVSLVVSCDQQYCLWRVLR